MVNEIPWNEMNVDGELTLQTSDPWARDVETDYGSFSINGAIYRLI